MMAIIKGIDIIIGILVLTAILLALAFAGYALWDSEQVHNQADKSMYTVYKPTVENEGKTFMELRELNDEVIAWLTVYDTNIDYPITQANDNMKYVTTNAEGRYSLSGSVFLDYRNSSGFTDFNSIIYGHNMDKKTMFGEIGYFEDEKFFDLHEYGNLYFDGADHGVEFFAFIHTDAYNSGIFWPNVPEDKRQEYLNDLLDEALNFRDVGVTISDRIVLLATCSPVTTNGRDILVGRITDLSYIVEDVEIVEPQSPDQTRILARPIHVVPFLLKTLLAIMLVLRFRNTHNRSTKLRFV